MVTWAKIGEISGDWLLRWLVTLGEAFSLCRWIPVSPVEHKEPLRPQKHEPACPALSLVLTSTARFSFFFYLALFGLLLARLFASRFLLRLAMEVT